MIEKGIYKTNEGLIEIYDYSKLHKCFLASDFVNKGLMFDRKGKQIGGDMQVEHRVVYRNMKEKQDLQTAIRNQVVEINKPLLDRLSIILSAHYVLASEMGLLISEMYDELEENGLGFGRVLSDIKQVDKALDKYFKTFSKLIKTDQLDNLVHDVEAFDKLFRKWARIALKVEM